MIIIIIILIIIIIIIIIILILIIIALAAAIAHERLGPLLPEAAGRASSREQDSAVRLPLGATQVEVLVDRACTYF